ncbi:hypothetical protein [Cupriavidus pauculus]|uniref:hypothetical protein n=1 Tax=Cupriavidus pauculus TaxID=82633 RepID=UPI001FD10167|nr:hypothetical protein [Cupriavidus pauculus]
MSKNRKDDVREILDVSEFDRDLSKIRISKNQQEGVPVKNRPLLRMDGIECRRA